ncbi:MAG: hypothetical protein ACYCSW_09960 [bacterium]
MSRLNTDAYKPTYINGSCGTYSYYIILCALREYAPSLKTLKLSA